MKRRESGRGSRGRRKEVAGKRKKREEEEGH